MLPDLKGQMLVPQFNIELISLSAFMVDTVVSIIQFLPKLYPSEATLQRVYWNCMVVIAWAITTVYCPISNLIVGLIKRGVN